MKTKLKSKAVERKPTPREIEVNTAELAAIRNLKDYVPPLATVVLDELLYPEQKAFLYTGAKRERMLAERKEHWATKLTLKLDRLVFPELMAGQKKLTEGKKLGRLLGYYKVAADGGRFENLKASSMGRKLAKKFLDAAWRLDDDFFADFTEGLNVSTPTLKVYSFMLRNRSAVQDCKSPSEIQKLPGMPNYSAQSFCRLCKSVGLPVAS